MVATVLKEIDGRIPSYCWTERDRRKETLNIRNMQKRTEQIVQLIKLYYVNRRKRDLFSF